MTKYILQRDSFSCGCVALVNILNYFGESYTYKDIPTFRKLLKTDKEYGTYQKYMEKELRSRGFSVGRKTNVYSENKVYLACYVADSKGIMHYIMIANGVAYNFHHFNKDYKMYTKFKLFRSWVTTRLYRKTIFLYEIKRKNTIDKNSKS